MNRSRKTRPWLLYALAVAAVTLAVLGVTQIGAPTSSARTSTQIVTAENGVVQSTVSGTGSVEAGADVNVNFQTSGTLKTVNVKAGQHVTKGQLLATLDSTSAQLSLDQAEQSLTAAQDQLSTAESGSTSTSTSTTSTASLNTSSGSGTGTTEFVSATKTTPTTSPTTTTPTTTTTHTTTPTTTTAPTATSPATTPSTAAAPSAGGGSGGSGSAGSGSSSTGSTTSPAGSIASAQAAVYSAEASVQSAKTALANTKLYAPITGTIVSLASLSPGNSVSAGSTGSASTSSTSSNGSSSASTTGGTGGTTAGTLGGSTSSSSSTSGGSTSTSSSSPFAEIVNTSTMSMPVALSESDISKVKAGQSANVTLAALTGVQLAAHVSAISTVGTSSNGVVSYNATLTLDQSNSQVKPGMSASALIIIAQAQGVNVPNSAITGTGSVATVTLDKNGKKTQQQVAIGLRGTSRTQIVSGLSAGDQLAVTTTLPPLTSGTSTTPSTGSGTLGGTSVRPGGFGGGGGGGFGGGGGARPGGTGAAAGG